MDLTSWHNNPSYSDLTIALSDDRKVHVHRSVLCTANEYFKTACGVNSQFVERSLSTIELKEDNPDAVEHVLRHIYKIAVSPQYQVTFQPALAWRYWLDVYLAADKYLKSALKNTTLHHIRQYAESATTVELVFKILVTLETEMAHDETCSNLRLQLFTKHLKALLKYDPFRRHIEQDTKTMWEIIDKLNITDETNPPNIFTGRRYGS